MRNLVDIPYIFQACYESCPFDSALFYRPEAYCLAYKSWNVTKKEESLTPLTNHDTEHDSQITNNRE
jgi:hypothetical protein